MTRRQVLALATMGLAGVGSPRVAAAEALTTVGELWVQAPGRIPPPVDAFHAGLRALGYVEDRTVRYISIYAQESDALSDIAIDLVRRRPDVMVTVGDVATRAVRDAGARMPIVMASSEDPVGAGLVSSLAYPGGNITGLSAGSSDLAAKRLDFLKRALPSVSRVAVLWNSTNPLKRPEVTLMQAAATTRGLTIASIDVRGPDEFESAFEDIAKGHAGAVIALAEAMLLSRLDQIVALASAAKLPVVYDRREFVTGGGLMFYGPNLPDLFRRAAGYVDRIVKGARPGDLPIEPATRFDVVVNGATAKTLGVAIPPDVLAQAVEVLK